jgi:hypothetical protein
MSKTSRARLSAVRLEAVPALAAVAGIAAPPPAVPIRAVTAPQCSALVSWLTSDWGATLTGLGIAAVAVWLFLFALMNFRRCDDGVYPREHCARRVDPHESHGSNSRLFQLVDGRRALAEFGIAGRCPVYARVSRIRLGRRRSPRRNCDVDDRPSHLIVGCSDIRRSSTSHHDRDQRG